MNLIHLQASEHKVNQVLADWFPRKNVRQHNSIYNVYYY